MMHTRTTLTLRVHTSRKISTTRHADVPRNTIRTSPSHEYAIAAFKQDEKFHTFEIDLQPIHCTISNM